MIILIACLSLLQNYVAMPDSQAGLTGVYVPPAGGNGQAVGYYAHQQQQHPPAYDHYAMQHQQAYQPPYSGQSQAYPANTTR